MSPVETDRLGGSRMLETAKRGSGTGPKPVTLGERLPAGPPTLKAGKRETRKSVRKPIEKKPDLQRGGKEGCLLQARKAVGAGRILTKKGKKEA